VSTHYFRFNSRAAADRRRSPLLERLLARADASSAVGDWRADAFRLIAPPMTPMPGVGAAAVCADQGPVGAGSVFMATPVHYLAEMSNVRLPADGILSLRQSEAEALALDFNRVWHDGGARLLAGRRAQLFCAFDQPLAVTTCDPEEVLDRHIESHLPSGTAASRLRQLMSEIEMWLFEHAVNGSRIAEGAFTVNGLWLWGGGSPVASLPAVDGWTAGDDPLFDAFAVRAEGLRVAQERLAGASSAVIVTAAQPGTAEWTDVESSWLERSVADLRSGRIARLELSSAKRCFHVSARWSWRLWRRLRPWWEHFE
jgi:hypothetical protein